MPLSVPVEPGAQRAGHGLGRRDAQRREERGRILQVERFELPARSYREKLVERYGSGRGQAFQFAEAFEVSEYGAQPEEKTIRRLFPFFG